MKKNCCIIAIVLAAACSPVDWSTSGNGTEEKKHFDAKDGVEYIYDGTTVPEVHISVTESEWNRLLRAYDKDSGTKEQVMCTVSYDKDGELTVIDSATVRLRGNTSRRRPEGGNGQMHRRQDTDWHHCHFQVNFHKLVKDGRHELHGARKIILKWFKDDPAYVRELYCYDLFRRAGVWTASNSAYCRLYIKVGDDTDEAYFGVYNMVEPVDDEFVKAREEQFGGRDGFLWKCRYGSTLNSANADFGADLDDGQEHTYELKTRTGEAAAATEQLKDFILKLNGKSDESLRSWIKEVCDVELLLRTYAVNVAVGMWDDYWNNCNNFYIYFDSDDKFKYKFYFIPFDYDNTLGTCGNCGVQNDAGRHDPFNWGNNSNPLIYRLLKIDEFRGIYKRELLALIEPGNGLFTYEASLGRIRKWHGSIEGMTANDTGEDMAISDNTASWSSRREYRLLSPDNNFFKIRSESIRNYCNRN